VCKQACACVQMCVCVCACVRMHVCECMHVRACQVCLYVAVSESQEHKQWSGKLAIIDETAFRDIPK